MSKAITLAKKQNKPTRQDKAVALVDSVLRSNEDDKLFFVPSQTDSDKVYEVVRIGQKYGCSCPDFLCRPIGECKHIIAVKLFIRQEQANDEVNLAAQIGFERESAARKELEVKYVLSGDGRWEEVSL